MRGLVVHQDARYVQNRELRIGLIIHATSCTLRTDWSEQQIHQILHANLHAKLCATGMAIIETGMAWFWSDRRIKKWSKIEGLDYLKDNLADGIIFVGIHFLTLELGARIVGIHQSGIGDWGLSP